MAGPVRQRRPDADDGPARRRGARRRRSRPARGPVRLRGQGRTTRSRSRPVTVRAAVAGEAVIDKGLAAGERVVTDGQLRLVPGRRGIKAAPAPAGGAAARRRVAEHRTELFIRRPVMTTLVMLGILLFGIMGYRLLPVSDLPNVDFPDHPGDAPACPAPARRPWPRRWRRRWSAVLHHRRPRLDDLDQRAGLDQHHAAVHPRPRTSTPPRRTCRRPSPRRRGSCRRTCRRRRPISKVNPADQPILYLALTSPTLPLSDVDEYAETLMAQRISMVSGVAQVQVYGSQKYAVRVQLDPERAGRRGIGIDEVASAIADAATSTCPPARSTGADQAFTVAGQRPAHRRRGLPAADRRLPQRRAGAAGGARPRHRQRRERQDRQPGSTTTRADRPGHPAPARHQHRGGGRRDQASCCPTFRDADARRRSSSTSSTTARESIRESVDDVKFTLLLTIGAGGPGDLPVPAQPLRHRHPQPGAADVDHRHLRRDVPAGLQPRQPLADGADAVGRLRGGRRHRDAGKHRPPHGDGRDAACRRRSTARARSASPSSP